MERKGTGKKTTQEYVRRSYSKFFTSSNRKTKAWRGNETKRILFLADEVMALCPEPTHSLWKQHWVSKILNLFCKDITINWRDRVSSKSSWNTRWKFQLGTLGSCRWGLGIQFCLNWTNLQLNFSDYFQTRTKTKVCRKKKKRVNKSQFNFSIFFLKHPKLWPNQKIYCNRYIMVNVLKKALLDYTCEDSSCPTATAICYVPCVQTRALLCVRK